MPTVKQPWWCDYCHASGITEYDEERVGPSTVLYMIAGMHDAQPLAHYYLCDRVTRQIRVADISAARLPT